MPTLAQLSALIGRIYGATLGDAEWSAVLEQMVDLLGAMGAAVFYMDGTTRFPVHYATASMAPLVADYTARQMLDHDAAYGGSHLALALVLDHQGDAAGADSELETARSETQAGFWRSGQSIHRHVRASNSRSSRPTP